jgi:carbon storage regulator
VLVLSRKPGSQVLVDGNIRITVLEIEGGRVKIGIEAPASVRLVRDDVRGAAALTPPPRRPSGPNRRK